MANAGAKSGNRVVILVLGLIILFMAGIVNAASIFVGPLAAHYGYATESIANVVTYYALMMTPGHLIGGWFLRKFGSKLTLSIGGILLGGALILSSMVPQNMPGLLYVTFSVIQGIGLGFCYTGGTYTVTGWWPDHRGFAAGACMAVNGGSSIILVPILVKAIAPELGPDNHVTTVMRMFGLIYIVVVVVCALGTKVAPLGYKPAGWEEKKNVDMQKVKETQLESVTASKVFKTKAYWHIAPAFGLFPLMYVIMYPRFSVMLTDAGFSVAAATMGVTIYNAANIIGRLSLGTLADKVKYQFIYWILVAISVVSSLTLIAGANAHSLPLFYVSYFLLGVGFGPVNSIHPVAISKLWGKESAGNIYGCVMLGYMIIGTLIAPRISAKLVASTGSYTASMIMAIICCVAAGILYTTAKAPKRRTIAEAEAAAAAAKAE